MASTDSFPVPKKNVAYRVIFPIYDADGDLVTGATGLDSEVSKDCGTFADCTNEATEIATSSGMYYLDLTSTEMNADSVAVIVKTSSSGAKTTPIVLYPEEAGDIRVDATMISGDATAADNAELMFDGTGYAGGTTKLSVNAVALSGDTTAADNAEAFFDGTGYAGTGNTIPTVTTVTNMVSANVTQISGDSVAADNLEAAADGTGYNLGGGSVVAASVTGAVGSVTGNVGGNVTGTIGGLTAGAVADMFDTNSGTTYASAVAGSLVKEIADNVAGGSLTEAGIADAVWDEAIAGHAGAGSTGAALSSAGTAGDPWSTALPGAYAAGTAGQIVGDMLDEPISSRLAPTTPGNTLDVNSDGEAGIDWANVGGQAAIVNLTNTGILAVGDGFGAIFATGDVVSATSTTTLLDSGAQAVAGFYVGTRLRIASGTGQNQERVINDYTAGRVATHAAWTVIPDDTSTYEIEPARCSLASAEGSDLVFTGAAGASEIAICNMALSHLGVAKEIANLETENSQEAAACRRFFAQARDNTLRDYPWPFATKIEALALVEEEPNDEWGYSYRVPSDFVRLRRILSGERNDTRQTRVSYRIVRDTAGLLIYTDQENAEIEYTIRETDPTRYPSDFVMALSLRLAAYIAPRLTGGDPFKLGERALQLHEYEIRKAQSSATIEEQADDNPDSEFIRERGE